VSSQQKDLMIIEGALMKILVYTIKRKICIPQEFSKVSEGLPGHSQLIDQGLQNFTIS
jgi:hypothetical protein